MPVTSMANTASPSLGEPLKSLPAPASTALPVSNSNPPAHLESSSCESTPDSMSTGVLTKWSIPRFLYGLAPRLPENSISFLMLTVV